MGVIDVKFLIEGFKGKILAKFGLKNFRLFLQIFAWFYAKSLSHSEDLILYTLHITYIEDVLNLSNVKHMQNE